MPVNSANKSVTVEGHYLAHQSARALNKRGDGQRLVQPVTDMSLDLNEEKKEPRAENKINECFVTNVLCWENGRSQRQAITPERDRERAASRLFECSLSPSVTISKMPLSKAFNLQLVGSQL